MSQILTGSGVRQTIRTETTLHLSILVKSLDEDGSATVVLTHDRIVSRTSSEPKQFPPINYDSDVLAHPPSEVDPVFSPVIGKQIEFRIATDGAISVVHGLGEIDVDPSARTAFDEFFADDALEVTYGELFASYTGAEPLREGTQWRTQLRQPDALGTKTLHLTLTAEDADDSNIVIHETGTMTAEFKSGSQIPKVKVLHSSVEGSRVWDIPSGLTKSLTRSEKSELQIVTLDGVTLHTSIDRSTTIEQDQDQGGVGPNTFDPAIEALKKVAIKSLGLTFQLYGTEATTQALSHLGDEPCRFQTPLTPSAIRESWEPDAHNGFTVGSFISAQGAFYACSRGALDEFLLAAAGDDEPGWQELLESGSIVYSIDPLVFRVLQAERLVGKTYACEVRIVDGFGEGRRVWTHVYTPTAAQVKQAQE